MYAVKKLLIVIGSSVLSISTNAALYDRGNGLVYDDVRNITWLQDANYANTSGYSETNAYGDRHSGESNIQADGAMSWDEALTWVEQLTYAGHDNWRLPSAGPAPVLGYEVTSGELGHMYYVNLGNNSLDSTYGACHTPPDYCLKNTSFNDAVTGVEISFQNVKPGIYWYEESFHPPLGAYVFYTHHGRQMTTEVGASYYAWAVADGDIAASEVPIPAAAWFFGSALLGLVGIKRRQ